MRKYNFFEKLLLPVGLGLAFFGLYMILLADKSYEIMSWVKLGTIFVWMIILFIVIMVSMMENMKEELTLIQQEHITEIKLLREILHEQLDEIKLLRKDFKK
ncbi:MAG: hypothetical protein NDI94_00970 [Candidatus Woesearchaeota archaeon]|jgi:hypothetical protein|nr:hypothetical protein [Candidatus Woesearchaeota archaeon]